MFLLKKYIYVQSITNYLTTFNIKFDQYIEILGKDKIN